MRSRPRARPEVEPFEARALMSVAIPGPPTAADVSTRIYPPPVLLSGSVEGRATSRPVGPDVGILYTFRGNGRVSPMGPVELQGTIQTTSLTGASIGSLTLRNRLGRVDIQVTSRPETRARGLPQSYEFTVTRATKQYAKLEGTGGSLDLRMGKGLRSFRMDLNPYVILSR